MEQNADKLGVKVLLRIAQRLLFAGLLPSGFYMYFFLKSSIPDIVKFE